MNRATKNGALFKLEGMCMSILSLEPLSSLYTKVQNGLVGGGRVSGADAIAIKVNG